MSESFIFFARQFTAPSLDHENERAFHREKDTSQAPSGFWGSFGGARPHRVARVASQPSCSCQLRRRPDTDGAKHRATICFLRTRGCFPHSPSSEPQNIPDSPGTLFSERGSGAASLLAFLSRYIHYHRTYWSFCFRNNPWLSSRSHVSYYCVLFFCPGVVHHRDSLFFC